MRADFEESEKSEEELKSVLGEGTEVRGSLPKSELEIEDLDCRTTVEELLVRLDWNLTNRWLTFGL